MSKIVIDNQTDLSDREVFLKIISCLADWEEDYTFTEEKNAYIFSKTTNK